MNKILFLGDSFTWGQGLYFYKWKDDNKKISSDVGGMYPSHSDLITNDDLIYKDKLSFTGLVGEHYNLEPIKRITNGGSNTDILLDTIPLIDRYNNSIDKVVFQFTTLSRYQFRDLNITDADAFNPSFSSMFEQRSFQFFNHIDGILKYYSNLYKFQYCYMDWLGDFYKFNPYKFIKYSYKEKQFYYFDILLDEYKIDIDINGHKIIDLHLNKDGQNILSTGIIKHFEE